MIKPRDILVLLQIVCFFLMTMGYPISFVIQFFLLLLYASIYITRQKKWAKLLEIMQRGHQKLYQWYRNRQVPTYHPSKEKQGILLFRRPSQYEDQPKEIYPQENK